MTLYCMLNQVHNTEKTDFSFQEQPDGGFVGRVHNGGKGFALRDRVSRACLELRPKLSYEHHLSNLLSIYRRIIESSKR